MKKKWFLYGGSEEKEIGETDRQRQSFCLDERIDRLQLSIECLLQGLGACTESLPQKSLGCSCVHWKYFSDKRA